MTIEVLIVRWHTKNEDSMVVSTDVYFRMDSDCRAFGVQIESINDSPLQFRHVPSLLAFKSHLLALLKVTLSPFPVTGEVSRHGNK
jgi:hypothetical protein